MGNQYYIEPQQSPILNFTNQLMHLKLAKEDQLLRQRGQEQAGQQFNVQQWGTPEAQPGMPTLHQRQVGAQEQQVANQTAQVPEHKKDFGSITAQAAVNEMTKLGVKKDNPLLGEIKGWATNKAINNERAYLTLKQNYGNYRDNIREEMAEDFVKKQEKDPNYGNTPEGRQHREVVGLLDNDETGDLVLGRYFGNTLKSMQMEEASKKTAPTLVKVAGPNGPIYVDSREAAGKPVFVPSTEKPSIGNVQAKILTKWLEGEPLTTAEEKIKDKYFRGEKDTYGDARMRYKAKVDEFESSIGRKATVDEKRRLFIQDPYGILGPSGEGENPIPENAPTATGANGQKIYWDGKNWLDAKTKKVVK
jgi:hypothetical protein